MEEEKQILELDFCNTPETLRGDYLDMQKGIQSEVTSTARFDENSCLSMTYLGRIDITSPCKIKAEEKFLIWQENYQMVQNVRYDWIQEKVNLSYPSYITYIVKLYIPYQTLHLKLKEFKQEIDNSLEYYHTNSYRYTW